MTAIIDELQEPQDGKAQKLLYRYDSEMRYDGGVTIYLTQYPVIRETPKGAWIRSSDPKFCLNGEGKRFAHTSKAFAYDSFKARKKRHFLILSAQLESVSKVQEAVKKLGSSVPETTVRWSEYDLMEFQATEQSQ